MNVKAVKGEGVIIEKREKNDPDASVCEDCDGLGFETFEIEIAPKVFLSSKQINLIYDLPGLKFCSNKIKVNSPVLFIFDYGYISVWPIYYDDSHGCLEI